MRILNTKTVNEDMCLAEQGQFMRRIVLPVVLFCGITASNMSGGVVFNDVTKETNITFRHTDGSGGKFYIMETVSAGLALFDYDNDGDTDIYVANDVMGNFLFQNDGTGKFGEVGLIAGVAYDLHGELQGSMGVDSGDYNNDGLFDFYVTSFWGELATLYKNLGVGMFEDVSRSSGAGKGTFPGVTWGASFVDFDNDGNRDIFVVSGHLGRNVRLIDDSLNYHQSNIFLMNIGGGKFVDMSDKCGEGMNVKLCSRGAGFDDLDNDGDVDIVILNSRREPTVLRNDSNPKGHWLQIRLRGVKTNRDGVGAHVRVTAGDLVLIDEVHGGRSYQIHYGDRLYFGLGRHEKVDRIEVQWIGDGVDVLTNVPVDKLLTITEGTGTSK